MSMSKKQLERQKKFKAAGVEAMNKRSKRPKGGINGMLRAAGFTREMVERKVADLMLMTAQETSEFKAANDTCNFDLIIIAIVEAAQRNADTGRLDNLLDKIFGKSVRVEGSIALTSNSTTNKDGTTTQLSTADAELINRSLTRALVNAATGNDISR